MTDHADAVNQHYATENLTDRLMNALVAAGKDLQNLQCDFTTVC